MLVNKSVRMSTSLEICTTTTYLNVLGQGKGVDIKFMLTSQMGMFWPCVMHYLKIVS